jgi:hypothetical protein
MFHCTSNLRKILAKIFLAIQRCFNFIVASRTCDFIRISGYNKEKPHCADCDNEDYFMIRFDYSSQKKALARKRRGFFLVDKRFEPLARRSQISNQILIRYLERIKLLKEINL